MPVPSAGHRDPGSTRRSLYDAECRIIRDNKQGENSGTRHIFKPAKERSQHRGSWEVKEKHEIGLFPRVGEWGPHRLMASTGQRMQ